MSGAEKKQLQDLLKHLHRKGRKTFKVEKQQNIGEGKIFAEYLKGEIVNFEELK